MLVLCGLFVAFQAGVGFLFGPLFAGHFSVPATITGVAGLATSIGAFTLAALPGQSVPWVRWSALLALVGVAFDIASYYMYLAIPGNYYPWFLVAPYALCLSWVGRVAHMRCVSPAERTGE